MAAVASKIFNDPIHGSIEMHPYLVRIIDTPEFQRLRYIRQMGSVYFVYPGASHNRFEHSIGVAHLAGELVQALNKRYHPGEDTDLDNELQEIYEERNNDLGSSGNQVLITEDEGLCVQIAALCHDLGHGPFSHLFDDQFIPKVVEKLTTDLKMQLTEDEKKKIEDKKGKLEVWTHEKQSQIMLENIRSRMTEIKDPFSKFLDDNHLFIKELIDPPTELDDEGLYNRTQNPKDTKDTRFKKQNPKTFLYEIVSNKRNGIDVDKMDYFARDCYHLGIENNFNCRRFFKFARVCLVKNDNESKDKSKDKSEDKSKAKIKDKSEDKIKDKTMQICMRDKEVRHIYELYHTRNNIHQNACQHRVVGAIDTMIVDALLLADEVLNISDSVLDASKYRMLTDAIYQNILKSNTEDLQKAQKIIERIESRNLYTCIYVCRLMEQNSNSKSKSILENELEQNLQQKLPQAEEKEFAVKIMTMASGMKGKDPIMHVKFYSKQDPCAAVELKRKDISLLLPNVFSETLLQVFSREKTLKELTERTDNFEFIFKSITDNFCKANYQLPE